MKGRLTSEQIKEICRIQHKLVITEYLISKMPVAYTNLDVHNLERDIKIRNKNEEYREELKSMFDKYGMKPISDTFSDKEYIQREENRFTFEEQRAATKEVIGKEYTLEEVLENY